MPAPFDPAAASFLPAGYNPMQAQLGLLPGGIPAPPPITFNPPPVMHPGQTAQMIAMQQAQYASPRPANVFGAAPLMHPGMMGPALPPPMFGYGMQARQRGIDSTNSLLGGVQAGAGLGMRGFGMAAAGMLGGPMGMMAYEGLGLGQGMQGLGQAVFEPIVAQRERALQLQSASSRFMVSGSSVGAVGHGMSMQSAQQASAGIGRLAENAGFRRDTGGMFNRADLDRITRLSGELGMLDQAGSGDQVVREVKKVSKALSNFMRLAEEPDIQQAMKQMSRLRTLGMNMPEISTAALNARTFGRMAGVSTSEAIEGAMRGASSYMQAGLSGATGFNAGLGAQGFARQLGATMDSRRLSMAGGTGGIESTLLQASSGALTNDAMLGAFLTRRNGQLAIDPGMIGRMAGGGMNISDMMRAGTQNISALGGRSTLMELSTRRRELQDQLGSSLGPQGQMLLPMMQAMMTNRQTNGAVSVGGALRMQGLDESQARTIEQAMSSPEFMANMQRSIRQGMQEQATTRRDEVRSRSGFRARAGRAFEHGVFDPASAFSERMMRPVNEFLAQDQDEEEAAAMAGDGPYRLTRRSRFGSSALAGAARDRIRRDSAASRLGMSDVLGDVEGRVADENRRAEIASRIPGAGLIYGPQGFGITRSGRGGDQTRDVILAGASTGTRVANFFGAGPSAASVTSMGNQQIELSQTMQRSMAGTSMERLQRGRGLASELGMSNDRVAALSAAASGAVREYTSSRRGMGGLTQRGATSGGQNAAIRQALRQAGASDSEIQTYMQSQGALAEAHEDARRGMSAEERQISDEIMQQGSDVQQSVVGQTTDRLREIANESRESAADSLGMNTMLDASDQEKRTVMETVSGTGSRADLQRKVFSAYLMSKSSDTATARRGTEELKRLELSEDPNVFDEVMNVVQSQVDSLSEATREDMTSRLEGKTSEQALAVVTAAGEQATRALDAEAQEGLTNAIGQAAASMYTRAGGGEAGVRALKAAPNSVTNRTIRRMIESGASDSDIAAAIEGEMSSQIDQAGTEMGVSGAGVSEEDAALGDTANAMLSAIREGMSSMPEAAGQLSEAARRLNQVADRLADAGGISRIARVAQSADADSGGLFSGLSSLF